MSATSHSAYCEEVNPSITEEVHVVEYSAVEKLVEAAKKLGLRCTNTGMYGPMGISPGECKCSTCEMKSALKEFEEGK